MSNYSQHKYISRIALLILLNVISMSIILLSPNSSNNDIVDKDVLSFINDLYMRTTIIELFLYKVKCLSGGCAFLLK